MNDCQQKKSKVCERDRFLDNIFNAINSHTMIIWAFHAFQQEYWRILWYVNDCYRRSNALTCCPEMFSQWNELVRCLFNNN